MASDIFIKNYRKGYSTTKNVNQYLKNINLQNDNNKIKSMEEFVDDINISYPSLWYLFDNNNYGINDNYHKDNSNLLLEHNYKNHIPFIISSQSNINIPLDIINDFTLSFWFSINKTFTFNLTANGTSAYIFETINDRVNTINGNNPDITIYEGDIIVINNNTGGHPFKINNATSITNQQSVSGGNSDTWKLSEGSYTYVCTSHSLMTGNITVIKNQNNLINSSNLIINVNNEILNINEFNCNIEHNSINHILLKKSVNLCDIYYNNNNIINLELTDITEINLGSNINYTDIRFYDFSLDKTFSLFNVGDNVKLDILYQDNLIDYHHYNKKITDNFNINLIGDITLTFWIYTDNQNNNLLTFDNFNFGIQNNRFFVKTFTENIIYANKKLDNNNKWYFISISIENLNNNHIVNFHIDNFPVIEKKFKNSFNEINSLITINSIFEDIKIYNKILNISEILDLYVTGIKLNKDVDNSVKKISYLLYDYKTEFENSNFKKTTFDLNSNITENTENTESERIIVTDISLDGLIVHYKFDGNNIDMLLDSSGNNHHLINHGGIFNNNDFISGNGSLELDGTYLEIPDTVNPYNIWNNKGITFSCWFKILTTSETNCRIFSFSYNLQNDQITVLNSNKKILFMIIGGDDIDTYETDSDYVDDKWHFLSWSIDISGNWKIYLDNVLQETNIQRPITDFTLTSRYIGYDNRLLNYL